MKYRKISIVATVFTCQHNVKDISATIPVRTRTSKKVSLQSNFKLPELKKQDLC